MKLGILYSGGKDSNYSLFLASKEHEISCLISLKSKNDNSYMFQSAGNEIVKLQSKALQIPLIIQNTKGEKEEELKDLEKAIKDAKKKYKIEGIVTGAIQSAYQSSRIQKICVKLDIFCFNLLWQINEKKYLNDLLKNKFEIILSGIFSYPLNKNYIGKTLNNALIANLQSLFPSPSLIGEGGEYESVVLDSPMFKKKIVIKEFKVIMDSENSGKIQIKKMELTAK